MSTLLRRAGWRYHAGRPGLLALSVVGVAVGVAVVVGIDAANSSARRAFLQAAEAVGGRSTHFVQSAGGVPDSVYVALRVDHGIRDVTPIVEGYARHATDGTRLKVLGIDPLVDSVSRDWTAASGFPDPTMLLADPGSAVLSVETAERLGVDVGDTLAVGINGRPLSLVVSGRLEPAGPVARQAWTDLVLVDVATGQEMLGMVGRLSRLDVVADRPADADRIGRLLPPGLTLEISEGRSGTLAQMTRAFELNLAALSYLALLVGMFLVYNIVSFSVVRRRVVLGRLRAIGVDSGQLVRLVLGEALIIGLVGTALGLVLGVALGSGLVRMVTRTINDLYFVVSVRELEIGVATWIKGLFLGPGSALIAAWGPARRAARVPPAAVLRRSEEEVRLRSRFPLMWVLALLAVVVGLAVLRIGSGIAAGYLGLLSIVVAFALVTPPVVDLLARLFGRLSTRMIWRMAVGGIRARLGRTSIAIASLSLAVAAAVGVGVMVQSFRATVDTWLGYSLQADLYAQTPGVVVRRGGGVLDPVLERRLRTDEAVRSAYGVRRTTIPTPVGSSDLIAIEHGAETRSTFRFRSTNGAAVWPQLDSGDAVAVSEPYANRNGVRSGDRLTMIVPSGPRVFVVAAVYFDYGSDLGTVMMSRSGYDRWFDDSAVNGLALFLHPEVDAERTARRLEASAERIQSLVIRSNSALRQASLDVFDQTFAVTLVLRLLAVIVAFVGILSALSALQLDRLFEFGVLRAIGLGPSALRGLVMLESAVMGLMSGLLAIPLGVALAAGLVFVINRRSFGWTLQFEIGTDLLLQAVAVAVVAGLTAAVVPAIRAGRLRVAALLRTGAVGLLLVVLGACDADRPAVTRTIGEALRVDTTGYRRALAPRTFAFPADHGPHPGYRIEWWYFTGNLDTPSGRPLGYQFTLFRTALRPPRAELDRSSALATNQLYMAHFAVTDPDGDRFWAAERFSRGAAGLAGAQARPFRVWLEDWEASGPSSLDSIRIRAREPDYGIDLALRPSKPIVLQGDRGFSRKGSEPGQASYYYAITRLETEGRVQIGGESFPVQGLSWFDREWSTSLLSDDQAGWDWFSLQLDDGHDLMYFQLRSRSSGNPDFVEASLVDEAGSRVPLEAESFRLRALDGWTSPASGNRYPSGWKLASEDGSVDLQVEPLSEEQELDVSVRYWEGAVRVDGMLNGNPVQGRGYVELTGYGPQDE